MNLMFLPFSSRMSLRQKGKGKRSTPDSNGSPVKKTKNGHQTNGALNLHYKLSESLQNQAQVFGQTWQQGGEGSNPEKLTDITYYKVPFQCGVISNVVENCDQIFPELYKELNDVEMTEKNNDLYKFSQSAKDLKHCHLPHISALREFLQTDVRKWLETVTNIRLDEDIDLFCAKYRYHFN